MSATDSPEGVTPPPEGTETRNAYEAFREASMGDFVLYGTRKEPLEVLNNEVSDSGRHTLTLAGPRGGTVTVFEEYTPTDNAAYRSDRGKDATNLRIVEQPSDDAMTQEGSGGMTPGVDGGQTAMPDDDDGPSTIQARIAAGELDESDIVDDDRSYGQPWPTPDSQTATREELDQTVYETTSDPMTDADTLFEGTVEGGPVRTDSTHPVDRYGTYTFVDELLQFGQDIPKSVNSWTLVEYGVIDDANSRRMAWFDADDEELLVLGAVRQPDEDQPRWMVWHIRNPSAANRRDPVIDTRDPYMALEVVSDVLYGDTDEVDISIEEGPDGQITVIDNLDDEALADRVLNQLVGLKNVPGQAASGVGNAVNYAGGFTGWARDTSDNVIEYFSNNKTEFAKMVKFALVYSAVAASKRIASAGIGPIIEEDKLGVYIDSKYTAEDVRDVPQPVPYIDTALAFFQSDSDEDAGGFKIDSELYINPNKFNFSAGPVTQAGLNYERLVDVAEVLNIDKLELNIPGAAAIRSLRVAEDEQGNVKVVRDEDADKRSTLSRTDGDDDEKPSPYSVGSGRSPSRQRNLADDEIDHRTSGGDVSGEHRARLRMELSRTDDDAARYAAANRFAAMYVDDYMDDEGEEFESFTENNIAAVVGEEWRKGTKDVVSNYYSNHKDASHVPFVESILDSYFTEGARTFEDATEDSFYEFMDDIPNSSNRNEDSSSSDSGGDDDADGGDNTGDDDDGDDDAGDATDAVADQAADEASSSLSDIAADVENSLQERMDEAARTGRMPDGEVVDSPEGVSLVGDILNQKSPSQFTNDDWVTMAAYWEESSKSGIRQAIRQDAREQGLGVRLRSDYTDEEVRDGEMTKDMFDGDDE